MADFIKSRVGVTSIEEHICNGILKYPYIPADHILAIEKSEIFAHDAFYHWYLIKGKHNRFSGVLLKDIKVCPFCGEPLSEQTPVENFSEPDEW